MGGSLYQGDLGEPIESRPLDVRKTLQQEGRCENSVPMSLRPIRLIQLIIDIALLSVTISLWEKLSNLMSTAACSIILIILSASFAIIMSIDAVGQIGGCLTPDLPMFLNALLGLILFTSAAQVVYLLLDQKEENGSVLVLIALCLVAALLFLLDAVITITYWRYTCTKTRECLPCRPSGSLTILYKKPSETLQPIERADISTSVSWDNHRPSLQSGFLSNGSNNRVGVDYRRQYVDRPSIPDSSTSVKTIQTQTQVAKSTERVDHEASAIAVVEEKDAQTLSPCPVCSAALDYSPKGICPAFLSLVQNFGMGSCTGSLQVKSEPAVLVDTGTLPGSNSSIESKESTLVIAKKPPRVYETRPCPTHGAGLIARKAGLPNPVTKISLIHSVRKNKRSQTSGSKPIVSTKECRNTEINIIEQTMSTESSRLYQSSVKVNILTQKSSVFEKTKEIETEVKEEDSAKLQGSSEGVKVQSEESSVDKKMEESTSRITQESQAREESLSLEVLPSPEKIDRADSQEDNISQENIVARKDDEIGSTPTQSNFTFGEVSPYESRESASPTPSCQCSLYCYKDVFGRYMCGSCAPKYLIKIPQRCTVKPIGDIRCFSCSQQISNQSSNAGQKCTCKKRCQCRHRTHSSSRK